MEEKFIADVHLGKLARWLRLLGFDTVYRNYFTNKQLLEIAKEENRILLSRNIAFSTLEHIRTFIVETEDAEQQLKLVIDHLQLRNKFKPFSRCLVCNNNLMPVAKKDIASQLEANTASYYDEFWQCENCRRIYWKGSHYQRMLQLIEPLFD